MARNIAISDPYGYGYVTLTDIGNGRIRIKTWISGAVDACCLRVYSKYTKGWTGFVPDKRLEGTQGKGWKTFEYTLPGYAQTCYARIEYHKIGYYSGSDAYIFVKQTSEITLASRKYIPRTITSAKIVASPVDPDGSCILNLTTNSGYNHFKEFEIQWYYAIQSGSSWLKGSSQTGTQLTYEYSYPSNAVKVYAIVKSVAATYKEGNNEYPYWATTQKKTDTIDIKKLALGTSVARQIQSIRVELVTGSQRELQLYITTNSGYTKFDHFKIVWYYKYASSDSWIQANESTQTATTATYSPPNEAVCCRCYVYSYSQTLTIAGQTVYYWTTNSKYVDYYYSSAKPDKPSCEIKLDYTKSAYLVTVNNSDPDANQGKVQINEVATKSTTNDYTFKSTLGFSEYTILSSKLKAPVLGAKYRARIQVATSAKSPVWSDWSDWSPDSAHGEEPYVQLIPATPTFTQNPYIETINDIRYAVISWGPALGAAEEDGYEIRWAPKIDFFDDNPDFVSSGTASSSPYHLDISDVEGELYFQIRASNESGKSAWISAGDGLTVHGVPSAPTVWAIDPTVILNEINKVEWGWTHNCAGEETPTRSDIQVKLNGEQIIDTSINDESMQKGYTAAEIEAITGNPVNDGDKMTARIRTYNHTLPIADVSPWSEWVQVQWYVEPTITVEIDSTSITSFPFDITLTNNSRFNALGWNLSILAEDDYEIAQPNGIIRYITKGEEIYSVEAVSDEDTYFTKIFTIEAANTLFQKDQSYRIKAISRVSNGGQAMNDTVVFTLEYASIDYDIRIIDFIMYNDTLSVSFKACVYENEDATELIEGVLVDVYRIPLDGGEPILVASQIGNGYSVTDTHPSLAIMQYRIVYTVEETGEREYKDFIINDSFNTPGTVIQWGNQMRAIQLDENTNGYVDGGYQGGYVTLPFNCDFQESYQKDVELLEYIGRKDPVSYYGTQKGRTYSISSVFGKEIGGDRLTALRRLADYEGDCYIRDSTGLGYYAQVDVSISNSYNNPLTSVSLTINRTSHEDEE